MDWTTGIQRAIDYLEAHITEEIDYADLAKLSYSSSYHFQRVFSLLCGHTLGEYIRLRRLTLAGQELASGKIKVIDAALKYGYESPDSFTRAFVRFHGITPSAAREPGATLNSFTRLTVKLTLEGGSNMNYRIEQRPEMVLTGYRRRFTGVPWGEERARQEEAFSVTTRAHQWLLRGASLLRRTLNPLGDMGMAGVVTNIGDDGYDYFIAYQLEDWEREKLRDPSVMGLDLTPFGFEDILLPPCTCAVFETERTLYPMLPFHDLREQIASQWLPASDFQLADAPELEIIHWYGNPDREKRYVELWLPIEG